MKDLSKLKVAIVHDWLVGGGAELVVLELHKMFPEAPIYTSYCTDEWREKLDNKAVTGWLQSLGRIRKFIPLLRIWWFTHLDLSDYDLVISSTGNGEAKGIKVPKTTKHICYCHTPTHFYWRHHDYYLKHPGFGPFASIGLKLLLGPLRWWDKKASQRPDYFIANSTHIQHDIKKYYGRDSVVIHPPVDVDRFASQAITKRSGFLTVGRQVPYKRVDIIVDVCTKLNLPLTVIGKGPEHSRLVRRAGKNVAFITNATDEEVVQYMSNAEAFILAAFEDFGITPVEALAAGTPVIAYKAGGALDYVVPNKTGLFFEKQSQESLASALKTFELKDYSSSDISKFAESFSTTKFQDKLKNLLKERLQ